MRFAACIAAAAAFSSERLTAEDHAFIRWVAKHNKMYGTRAEYEFRAAQFKKALAEVEAHNSKNDETHTLAVNEFADYTENEWAKMRGYKRVQTNAEPKSFYNGSLDDAVNWVDKGAVTPVKNQGSCGSCWAFSTTGAVEGAYFIKHGEQKSFSEQQLVDCDRKVNQGCNGGDMAEAFKYIESSPLELESDYPYKGRNMKCSYDKTKGVGTVSDYTNVVPDSEQELKAALMKGPVSVAIEADRLVFQLYHQGVITSKNCGTNLDHGVLAVGYGTENGQDYYLVKNSWGPSWGDKGYVKIGAEAKGHGICGIQMDTSIPTEK